MKAKASKVVTEQRLGDRALAAMEKLQQVGENRFTKRAREIFKTPPYSMKGGLNERQEKEAGKK